MLLSALEQAELIQQELARRHLLDFICLADPTYKVGAHHRIVANQLEATYNEVAAVKAGRLHPDDCTENRIIITMPPRHGKSRMCTEEFPAWGLGNHPDLSFIITSYSADLAYDFSRRARNRLAEHAKLFGIRVAPDSAAVGRWSIEKHPHGGLVASGVGGPITGRGAHIAIIDDPFKNWQEAASKTIRENVKDWYRTTLRTRLAPGGAIIVILTRWHEDDLAGWLLKEAKEGTGEQWKVINLPAIAEEDGDLVGRKVGEALWPDMFGVKYLEDTKMALGSYLFNALYQQRPRPAEGTIFKRQHFRYFDVSEGVYTLHREDGLTDRFGLEQCWHFQTCDPAGSSKDEADYFVLSTWVVTPRADLLLYDVQRLHIEGADQPSLISSGFQRFHPSIIGIESKGIGLTLFQILRNSGLPVHELKAETDKVTRSLPVAARYEAHKVFHMQGAHWLGDWEDELTAFPKGQHDDQVDTASYAAILLAEVMSSWQGSAVAVLDDPVLISPV